MLYEVITLECEQGRLAGLTLNFRQLLNGVDEKPYHPELISGVNGHQGGTERGVSKNFGHGFLLLPWTVWLPAKARPHATVTCLSIQVSHADQIYLMSDSLIISRHYHASFSDDLRCLLMIPRSQ